MKHACLSWPTLLDSTYLANFHNHEMTCFAPATLDVTLLVVDNLTGRYEGDIGDLDDGV